VAYRRQIVAQPRGSVVLTLRVPPVLDRRIERVARRKRQTKSAVLREALQNAFGGEAPAADPAREARRQSLLVSGRGSEREVLDFIEHANDDQGWR
jgi:hypothetical protein